MDSKDTNQQQHSHQNIFSKPKKNGKISSTLLPLLLLDICGDTSFENLQTVGEVELPSFKEA